MRYHSSYIPNSGRCLFIVMLAILFVMTWAGASGFSLVTGSVASAQDSGSGSDDPSPTPTPSPTASPTASPTPLPSPTVSPTPDNEHCRISFSSPTYTVNEDAGLATITVVRACDRIRESKVDFFTRDGSASNRSDFTFSAGRLFFGNGVTTESFNVLITNDVLVEGNETVNLFLSDPGGSASLADPSTAVLTIVDNDTTPPTSNPIEQPDFFVNQHYADFLNRQADDGGRDYWSGRIRECGANEDCIRDRRIDVSAAFFIEAEFQQTGSYVYRLYEASLGRHPSYDEFMPDRGRLVATADLEANKALFSDDWVQRPEFKQHYPETMTPFEFVNRLMDTAGLMPFVSERQRLVAEMESGATRSQIIREIIEIPDFKEREYNAAFVLMQYFGYLRRDPDQGGYDFWLNTLNNRVPGNYRSMVCAFLTSAEMQDRFSNLHVRSNAECR